MSTHTTDDRGDRPSGPDSKRILVIDDEASIRDLCRKVLEDAGFAVSTAANGAEGLRLFREHAPDLVVCDIFMPEMDGLKTIPELAKQSPGLKVIAMSGGAARFPDFLPVTKHLGAVTTLSKPFSPGELLGAVARALGDKPARETPDAP